ncbi:hypothetical protein F5Y04DRAFT_244576 [Hypomontagnella monticulosa]|nr:hypothetical protein F5Y04DRAFT_244576 [Hypomontagnella monticulosa]
MPPTAKRSGDLAFIVSTSTKKPDPELRKFIRSHVMIGKNRGRTLRPRYNKIADSDSPIDPSQSNLNQVQDQEEDESARSSSTARSLSVIPRRVGSDLSFVQFADKIEDSSLTVIFQFSAMAKGALFPLESCIAFGPKETKWMEALTLDAAYLHAMAFSAHAYFEMLPGRNTPLPPQHPASTRSHVLKTLRLLRERIETPGHDAVLATTFSTAAIVLCLAFHAHVMGEHDTAMHHMLGLRKIVDLKGGLSSLADNVKLVVEILRCDIGMALHSGAKPLFFADRAREPFWPFPDFGVDVPGAPAEIELDVLPSTVDPELRACWRVMRQFCALVNDAAVVRTKLPKEYLFDTMAAVTYRLLHKSPWPAPGTIDNAVLLGLLAFSSSIFLQWSGVRLPSAWLPTAYRECLLALEDTVQGDDDYGFGYSTSGGNDGSRIGDSSGVCPRPLLLWLLTVGAVSVLGDHALSVFGEGDSELDYDLWLRSRLRANAELCGVESWFVMRALLSSFMWVGLVHDAPGKAIFESAMSLNPSSEFC